MLYGNGQTNLHITKENDRELIKSVIKLFLEKKSIAEISEQTGLKSEIVEIIVKKREWIIKFFSEEEWEKVKLLLKQKSVEEHEKEYEKIMDNIIALVLNSLYTFEEIAMYCFITTSQLSDMLNDVEFIEKHYGKCMAEKIQEAREKRKKLPQERITGSSVILRAPEYRMIVKPNVIAVDSYSLSLIDTVLLFLDHKGNTQAAAMNSKYTMNEIVTALSDIKLKELLFEHVYINVQKLLEIDSILTQNKIQERNNMIKTVIEIANYEEGNLNRIQEALGYSEAIIRRILSHPYVTIYCCKNNIEIPTLKREDEGQITDTKNNSNQKTL